MRISSRLLSLKPSINTQLLEPTIMHSHFIISLSYSRIHLVEFKSRSNMYYSSGCDISQIVRYHGWIRMRHLFCQNMGVP